MVHEESVNTAETMETDLASIKTIELVKDAENGLGFMVQCADTGPPVRVSAILEGSAAEKTGGVLEGDRIVSVNGIDLIAEHKYEDCVKILRSLPIDQKAVLRVKRMHSHKNGSPSTGRGTKTNGISKNSTTKSETGRSFGSPIRRWFGGMKERFFKKQTNSGDSGIETTSEMKSVNEQVHSNTKLEEENLNSEIKSDEMQSGDQKNIESTALKGVNAELKITEINVRTLEPANGIAHAVGEHARASSPSKSLSVSPKLPTRRHSSYDRTLRGMEGHRNVGCPIRKAVKLKNWETGALSNDSLHLKLTEGCGNESCVEKKCIGSFMRPNFAQKRGPEELMKHAKDFVDQYYASIKRLNTSAHEQRWQTIKSSIENTGTYELTTSELTFGAKTAWRNASRCIGRIQWSKLQIFDARHITSAYGMYEAVCNHIKYGTNKGVIRSAITVFPARQPDGLHDFRVWNGQLIMYAGYKQDDGSVIGDKANVEFTEICQKLGWKGQGGRFDILPLVLSANGRDPELFEIPKHLILEVELTHPQFSWFKDLGLKWYCLPAVSSMLLDCGGLQFTAVPFNGWYMSTEIVRDLCDRARYDILPAVASSMGLDIKTNASLWQDKAFLEVNVAVLHSFQQAKVSINDHHTTSESFMRHLANEERLRGGCPGDWVWMVPPMSGSVSPLFHQEFLNYKLYPSYEYQADPWHSYDWKKSKEKRRSGESKDRQMRQKMISFRDIARAVKFSAKMMKKALSNRLKCTVLFATETGRSETFAQQLAESFNHVFHVKVQCMADYNVHELEHETLVLIVTSTFGNGDPPDNGEEFSQALYQMKYPDKNHRPMQQSSSFIRQLTQDRASLSSPLTKDTPPIVEEDESVFDGSPSLGNTTIHSIKHQKTVESVSDLMENIEPLSNVRYSVFGLGSRAYPNFCAFAHYLDNLFGELGAERIFPISEGDELCGQEESFHEWAVGALKAACDTLCVGDESSIREATEKFAVNDRSWAPGKYRLLEIKDAQETNILEGLSAVHRRPVVKCTALGRESLQSPESNRKTILVKLGTGEESQLDYIPGDHLAVFPSNHHSMVEELLRIVKNAPEPDQLVQLQIVTEKQTPLGIKTDWQNADRFPPCTFRTALTWYLDITATPSQTFLLQLSIMASSDTERDELIRLAKDTTAYDDWKYKKMPNLVETLHQFPSCHVSAAQLLVELPVLKQRFYSISSSPKVHPGEIHLTVAVVQYMLSGSKRPRFGICSTWLNRLREGDIVPCFVRPAPNFHLPEDHSAPIIMVGPGTGIAPFRSFWQERAIELEMKSSDANGITNGITNGVTNGITNGVTNGITNGSTWGKMQLYFGCRQADIDLLYKDETTKAQQEGVLSDVYVALSRETNIPKTYVQHIMLRNEKEVYQLLIENSGHIYICGDVTMAADVSKTLETIFKNHGMSQKQAESQLLHLKDTNHLHEDIFGVTLRTAEVTDYVRQLSKSISQQKFCGSASADSIVNGGNEKHN